MTYTVEEVFDYIEQEDVSFIRLAFCDIHGKQKNVSIMPNELRLYSFSLCDLSWG